MLTQILDLEGAFSGQVKTSAWLLPGELLPSYSSTRLQKAQPGRWKCLTGSLRPSAPVWPGSCCQLLCAAWWRRKIIAFVLSSSLPCLARRAASVRGYCSLPGPRKQAQGFAELRVHRPNAAATLEKSRVSRCADSASAACALLQPTGGGRQASEGRDAVVDA